MQVLLIQKPDSRLKRTLQDHGYVVHSADSAVTAAPRAISPDCNLILLDLDLPGPHGLRWVEDWRDSGIQAPVLVLTSRRAAADKAKALNVGADALVTKPYHREELIAQIKALLRRSPRSDDSIVQVGDLEIDAAAREARRAGKPIKLTRRELALLQYLAANRGKVVSRSMILANVFDEHHLVASNAVDVHICSLRNKIDKGFGPPLLQTCYGEGYMLRGDT